jgi:hypothetical protein
VVSVQGKGKRNDAKNYEIGTGEISMRETWACMSIQAATQRVRLRQGRPTEV